VNHYTYEIEFENGMKYVGVRSCKKDIHKDSYLGSSKIIPPELYATCVKRILGTFETRLLAVKEEIRLHEELDIALNINYYNQVKQTTAKFDQAGTTKETHKHIERMAEKLRGRTKEGWEYLEVSAKKSSALRGSNRTDSQRMGDVKSAKYNQGRKNPRKGNSGTNSAKYAPWYYITDEGMYHEIYTTLRSYALGPDNVNNFTYSLLGGSITRLPHMPIMKGKFKGFVFGYLHSKPDYLTQENIRMALQVLKHLPYVSPNKQTRKVSDGAKCVNNITGKN